jgi:hypothetical protein
MDKKYSLLTAGSVGLIVAASAAMAAAPGTGGFGQYNASGGTVTGCNAGATCSTLVTGNGFLQQQVTVTAGQGAGSTYFRTIILDAGATNGGSGFGNSTFADESYVDATAGGGGNMADQNYVGFVTPGEAGSGQTSSTTLAGVTIPTNSVMSILGRGNLAAGTDTAANLLNGTADARGIKIVQNNDFNVDMDAGGVTSTEDSTNTNPPGAASGSRAVNFLYISDDDQDFSPNVNHYMRIDEFATSAGVTPATGGTDQGPMTVRESSGLFTTANDNGAGTGIMQLPDGQTLAYSAGDDIKVSWISTSALGGGSFGYPTTGTAVGNAGSANAVVEAETFTNKTTGESIGFVNDTHPLIATNPAVIAGNLDPSDNTNDGLGALTGYPQTLFTPQNTTSTFAQWNSAYWDPNFGSAPVGYDQNAAHTGATPPPDMATAFPQ